MTLSPSMRLGVYEVIAQIGVGGMGQVFRAHDTRLNRDVALKILSDAVASDPDRLARFTREAQTLASLNHPHIAQIHGLEESGAVPALVMELVEGEDLSQRIARGAIALADALPMRRQIADALEAAHEQGIIHRDLKPANIQVREDGTVKVLDFGLAKAFDPSRSTGSDPMNSPTISFHATQAGIILGTAAYMSPEQAKGHAVDRRADLWAFGAVLYEMLTGRRAFGGEDVSDTLVSVLRDAPDLMALPAATPASIRKLLRRCLEKDRKRRLDSAADAVLEIDDAMSLAESAPPAAVGSMSTPSRHTALIALPALAGGALIAALTTWALLRHAPSAPPTLTRFTIVTPAAYPLRMNQGSSRDIAISPDGTRIVYRIGAATDRVDSQLVVRALSDVEVRPLAGAAGREPFMSPDGRWIGFFTDVELRKVAIAGGPSVAICKINEPPRGASWGPDDTIIFGVSGPHGLQSVAAGGGESKAVSKVEPGETVHM